MKTWMTVVGIVAVGAVAIAAVVTMAAAQPGSAASHPLHASDERRSPGRCLRGQLLERRR